MRFLCLHGMGTNADIFESQLAPFITRYDSEHTFDFIDAPYECSPAPGISTVFPPPYLAWHLQYEPNHIQEAHNFLKTIIKEDGPYDGVIGFSQGAALAASFILCDEYHGGIGWQDSPFKIAIFFNSVMVFSPSEHIGCHIGKQVEKIETKHAAFLEGRTSDPSTPKMTEVESNKPSYKNIYGFDSGTFSTRISLPTLHVLGTDDQFKAYSQGLVKLCQSEKAEILAFDAGHEIPRTEAFLQKCGDMFELVVMMASLST